MKTLYISCDMGVAGDMLSAALFELFDDRETLLRELNDLQIPHVRYEAETVSKCGVSGTQMHVYADGEEESEEMHEHHHHHHEEEHHHHHDGHHHSHNGMHGIAHIVKDHISASEKVKNDVMNVYQIIAEAESHVHGVEVSDIHFHEVGTADAIADITAVCYMLEKLQVEEIIASPVHVGQGTVKCAHGILPVPAPATAQILKGVPIYSKENIVGELCTPTGAALLKYFVKSFKAMPLMTVEKIGQGMGKKDFTQINCLRVFLGTSPDLEDQVVELSCNVDDMTGEEIGYALNKLMENGALDAFTVPIGMKKGRPGIMIHAVCRENNKLQILQTLFRNTSTIGVRETVKNRYVLDRVLEKKETEFGEVRYKRSFGYGTERIKYEYDDLSAIAAKTGLSLREILSKIGKE
ncbi:MAG: nickel pincer cofactor biosynthesis protein LarC [Lachnospiraceae bacterium]|nr:nickel pincer cofactor biosynthesis protein LarC [Lachnospiraceae bacterium]